MLALSHQEKIEIRAAMGLSKGHWYKCARSHLYYIGDCGRAASQGTCPECRSTIGAASYNVLVQGNAVAPEME